MDGIRQASLSCTAFLCCGVFLCIAYFSGVRVNFSGSLLHRLYRIAVLPEGKTLSRGELIMPDYRKIDNPAITRLCSGRDNAGVAALELAVKRDAELFADARQGDERRSNTGFEGTDTFVYEICNTDGCASATVTIDVLNKIVPYNGMSVDGDGKNDYFQIGRAHV